MAAPPTQTGPSSSGGGIDDASDKEQLLSANASAVLPWAAASAVCAFLPLRDRLLLAALFRLPRIQAAALNSSPGSLLKAAHRGDVAQLDFRLAHGRERDIPKLRWLDAAWNAIMEGNILVLEWLKARRLPVAYIWDSDATKHKQQRRSRSASDFARLAIDEASRLGRVAVLQWWRDAGAPMHYSEKAADSASKAGQVAVLEWWAGSGLEVRYSEAAMDSASCSGQVEVLRWWRSSGLPLRYTKAAMNEASFKGHTDVLEWWKNSGLAAEYTHGAVDGASSWGHVEVLEWWKGSGLQMLYSHYAMDEASAKGHTAVLQWWRDSGLELKFSDRAVRWASTWGHTRSLEWWRESEIDANLSALAAASLKRHSAE